MEQYKLDLETKINFMVGMIILIGVMIGMVINSNLSTLINDISVTIMIYDLPIGAFIILLASFREVSNLMKKILRYSILVFILCFSISTLINLPQLLNKIV